MKNVGFLLLPLLLAACGCASLQDAPRTKVALIVEACATNGQVIANRTMTEAVSRAGFLPAVLPRLSNTNRMDEMIARADALVVFGSIKGETDERYRFERCMVRKAAAQGIPVVGICNGIQQVNAAFGGSYVRNEKVVDCPLVHRQNVNWKWLYHDIDAKPGSLVAQHLGEGLRRVNSSHNYSLQRVADGFEVTARAPDGVIEAIEHRTKPIVGFQFHPEYMAVRDGDEKALGLLKAALEGRRVCGPAPRESEKPLTKVALIADACPTNRHVIGCQTTSKAISAAGFIPLVLPNAMDDAKFDEILGRADALVIFGSIAGEVQARYDFERKLIRKAAARNMPVLGICNGHQQINIALGGTIDWNTTNSSVKVGHRWKASTWTNDQFHAVSVKPGSLLAKTWGAGRQEVNSSHMYSVQKLAPDFDVTAIADDGVIEAIEHRTKPIVGVQFHPERLAVRDGNTRAFKFIKAALEGKRPSELKD